MICRFCSQWNQDGINRCCFCNNPADAEKDQTLTGRAAYTAGLTAPLPPVERDHAGLSSLLHGAAPGQVWRTIGAVIAGLIGLIILWKWC